MSAIPQSDSANRSIGLRSRLGAWIGKKHRKHVYVRWLSSISPDRSLRSFVPRSGGKRLYVPASPRAKVHAIRWHARHFSCRLFVETGTCWGYTTAAVADMFERCWTIELSDELHALASKRFAGTNIECLHGDSGKVLPAVISALSVPALFWLDAHATGGTSTADAGYDPIMIEVEAIVRSPLRHVVLIDDANSHDFKSICQLAGRPRCSVRNNIIRIEPS